MKNRGLYFLSFGIVSFAFPASAETVEVTSAGVGIGTSTPTRPLHVARNASDGVAGSTANSYEIAQFKVSGTGGIERGLEIGAPTGSVTSPVYLKVHGTSNRFALLNDTSTEQFTVLNSGNVGIGASSPSAKLEVIGGANAFGLIVEGDGSSANARIALRRGNSTSATGNIDWVGNNNSVGARIGVNDDVGGSMAFKLGGSAQSYTRLFISSGGNVGIGNTDPGNKLHVSGTGGYAGLWLTNADASGTTWGINQDSNYNYGLNFSEIGVADARLFIAKSSGNVGIGTASPSYKLHVSGSVRGTSFISDTTTYADFVFKPGYKLASLSEVEAAIQKNGHLPDIPSEAEAKAHGIDLAAMQVKLLQKVEELTLHLIAHEKELRRLSEENAALHRKLSERGHL
jgi:hypothetical protein